MNCTLPEGYMSQLKLDLKKALIVRGFKGFTADCSGEGKWWTGSWIGVKWTGNRHIGTASVGPRKYTASASQIKMTYTITYNIQDLGTWEDIYGS